MQTFKIDDLARETGLTKRAIRYYEEIGLLPAPERSKGGIRLYVQSHIDRLKQIVNARDVLGFTLQEIHDFVSISEALEDHRLHFRQMDKKKDKLGKLLEIEQAVRGQLDMITHKLEKMTEIQAETQQLHDRVIAGIAKLRSEEGKAL